MMRGVRKKKLKRGRETRKEEKGKYSQESVMGRGT